MEDPPTRWFSAWGTACALPLAQPDRERTRRIARYLRGAAPLARGGSGFLVAAAAVGLAVLLPDRAALAVASTYLLFEGSYCLLNFLQRRETHCAVTGPGWTATAVLGYVSAALPGPAAGGLAWYPIATLLKAMIGVWLLGFVLEYVVAGVTGRRALRYAARRCTFVLLSEPVRLDSSVVSLAYATNLRTLASDPLSPARGGQRHARAGRPIRRD